MTRRRSGSGLIAGGTIVTVIGLWVVAVELARVPRYWLTILVGVGPLALGAPRRVMARTGEEESTARR